MPRAKVREDTQRNVAARNEDQATANERELAGSAVASLWRNKLFASIRVHSWLEKSSRKNRFPAMQCKGSEFRLLAA